MHRLITTFGAGVLVFALSCFAQPKSASAIVFFDGSVDINFSQLGAGFSDVTNVEILDFFGNLASNGTNADGTQPVAGVDARVVGFATNVTSVVSGSPEGPLGDASDFGHGGGDFEVTAVIRDWNGTIESVTISGGIVTVTVLYDNYAVTGPFSTTAMPDGTGFIDLYVDTGNNFTTNDAEDSSDGTWIATFGIKTVATNVFPVPPRSEFTFSPTATFLNGTGKTQVTLELVSAFSEDFFTDPGSGNSLLGGNLALLSLTSSTETVLPDPPLLNIFAGAGDPVDVGAGWDPPTANTGAGFTGSEFPFDIVSKFDSSNEFEVVPEPSSLVMFSMAFLGLGWAGLRRRRGEKSAA